MIGMSAYSFLPALEAAGVKVFRYIPGFMHQKVMLVDDYASVGTANFDNRSFRLNFEITMVLVGAEIARDVEAMLLDDFSAQRAGLCHRSHRSFFPVPVWRQGQPIDGSDPMSPAGTKAGMPMLSSENKWKEGPSWMPKNNA